MKTQTNCTELIKSNVVKLIIGLAMLVSIIGILSCSQKSGNIQSNKLRLQKLEKEIDSLTISGEFDKVRLLYIELNKLKREVILSNPFWKGRPYAQIMDELAKQYNLIESEDFEPTSTNSYKTILQIFPYNIDPNNSKRVEWNMEDANKIKKIIMKILTFEPEVDEYSSMTWTASKYDIEISKTGSGDIRIEFLTKQE